MDQNASATECVCRGVIPPAPRVGCGGAGVLRMRGHAERLEGARGAGGCARAGAHVGRGAGKRRTLASLHVSRPSGANLALGLPWGSLVVQRSVFGRKKGVFLPSKSSVSKACQGTPGFPDYPETEYCWLPPVKASRFVSRSFVFLVLGFWIQAVKNFEVWEIATVHVLKDLLLT